MGFRMDVRAVQVFDPYGLVSFERRCQADVARLEARVVVTAPAADDVDARPALHQLVLRIIVADLDGVAATRRRVVVQYLSTTHTHQCTIRTKVELKP